MTVMYLLLKRRAGEREANRFIQLAVNLAIVGTSLYFACPAVGPTYAFNGEFPYRIPQASVMPVSLPLAARNCVPSRHTAWIRLRWGVGLFTLSPAAPYGLTAVSLLSPLWSGLARLPAIRSLPRQLEDGPLRS